MKLGVVGIGHVGLVTAACFAHVGHDVVGVDSDSEKIEKLWSGSMPFFEPGLAELVEEGTSAGRLVFDKELSSAVEEPEVIFICVGTPSKPSGEADLAQVEKLCVELSTHMSEYRVLVEKSTVPIKTGARLVKTFTRLLGHSNFDVVSNPEFLREGSAIQDTLNPERLVIGSPTERATNLLLEAYRPTIEQSDCPVVLTDVGTAELIKHASNAFLATKISFINAVAEICERTGADVETVAAGMGHDPRIGPAFLRAGIGWGGSCFPKDVAAFVALSEQLGYEFDILKGVQAINERGPSQFVDKLRQELWNLEDKTIAVLGLAFKPGTDDLRAAPALKVVEQLLAEGANVVAYDPVAMPRAKKLFPALRFADSALDAVRGADAAAFLTEWNEFRGLDLAALRDALKFPIVVDGRNLFSPAAMREAGVTYLSVGRPAVRP
jgi:UDPglucose 6-dehydrogenase